MNEQVQVLERVEEYALMPVRGFEESVIVMNRAAFERVGTWRAAGCYVDVVADDRGAYWPTRPQYEVVWQMPLPGLN